MPKGPGDKPKQKVTIVKSGEIPLETQLDANGEPVPYREEL